MRKLLPLFALLIPCVLSSFSPKNAEAAAPRKIKLVFLGDKGHHKPEDRFRQVQGVFATKGIDLNYTENLESLNPGFLKNYDGVLIFANHAKISDEQEKALLDFVEAGKALIPVHCASYCFLNSQKYIDLVGAQFSKHGTGIFSVETVKAEHPIMKNYEGFQSWDETYVHTKHNEKDRIVLEVRKEKNQSEPWTWIRNQGKGRVFYTAWGHDQRTWGNPGFQNLLERGIRWAVGDDPSVAGTYSERPKMTSLPSNLKPFEYVPANVPNYLSGASWGKMGDNIRQMQKPLEPSESQKHYVMPEGFELKLFASEPQLEGKPICMNWDERGRLWVALTIDYPNELQPPGEGRDKIVICEDTNGDNVADKFTVFADKLSIPTSIAFANGGIIVHQAPDTLFLKDTNGDDKVDERKVLFSGWITRDTHAGPSNMNYGLDNWIYGMVGYSGFEGTIGTEKQSFRTGFYRFKPDGSQLEFLRNTNNNSWGVGISEEGILFGSTANGNPSVHMPIPNRYYEKVRGWSSTVLDGIAGNAPMFPITKKVRQVDWHDHFTAAAGHALYTARNYPASYWNKTAFVTEPTGHIVATFPITAEGTSYTSRNAFNLLASDDEWSSPIVAEVGPDGNVWIVDWYNFIVQHNPTPSGFKTGKGNAYETELRDKKHGRIYRLVYKSKAGNGSLNLSKVDNKTLVQTLKNDNLFWRRHAQRLLVERKATDIVSDLLDLAKDKTLDDAGLAPGTMHALWTLKALGELENENAAAFPLAVQALKHPAAGVRLNAVKVLPPSIKSVEAILAAKMLEDSEPQVRLAATLALADQPAHKASASAITTMLKNPKYPSDRWMLDALVCAAANNDKLFIKEATTDAKGSNPDQLMVLEKVAEHFARGNPKDEIHEVLQALVHSNTLAQTAVLRGLARGWPANNPLELTEKTETILAELFNKASTGAKGQLALLGKKWKSKALQAKSMEVVQSFIKVASDSKQNETERIQAARQACEFGSGDASVSIAILDLINPQLTPEVGNAFIEATGLSERPETAKHLVEKLSTWPPSLRQTAIRSLLSRSNWLPHLLDGLEANKVRLGELSLDQKQALTQTSNRSLANKAKAILAKGGGLPNPDRQKVVDEYQFATTQKGDANAGKLVFKNQCSKCHQHQGEGVKIGPDLTGMASHPKKELLIHIMDPNRDVEGNFRQYVITTSSGKVLNGMLASETKSAIELIDTEAKKQTVLREDIEEMKVSDSSLMPEGFEKQLKKEEVVNLLEFLTQRGKYLPIPLDKVATIVSTKGMFHSEDSSVERIIFPDWKPKNFQGIPFHLVDPEGTKHPNVILLHSTSGTLPEKMPKQVKIPCNGPAKAIHLLSGIGGWSFPANQAKSVSMIVRLHYQDGKTEDHPLKNGEHFADYIRRVDVPESTFAFAVRSQQVRYLSIKPQRTSEAIKDIEFIKGPDKSAPLVIAVTVESPEGDSQSK